MKKIITLLLFTLFAVSVFAQDTVDLNFKFKEKELNKHYSKITINGQMNMMGQITPYQSLFDGIMSENTIEITKEKNAKKITSYNFKDIQSTNEKASEMVKPKTIGYEIDAKGKIYNILNEKGVVTQKIENSNGYFPKDPVKVGDSWECQATISGINIKAKSTLKEIKTEEKVKFAIINTEIDTPIDVKALMQLMGITGTSLGAYDQMEIACYCQGKTETTFNIETGKKELEKTETMVYLEGGLYGQVIMQGQFKIEMEQKAFTAEDYKKYATK